MLIYGKTLREVFTDMPWAFRIVVVCGIAFIIFTCYHATVAYRQFTNSVKTTQKTPQLRPLYSPEKDEGLLDPSIATDGKKVAVSYTALTLLEQEGERSAAVRIMTSQKPCKTWTPLQEKDTEGGGMKPGGFASASDQMIGPDSVTPLGMGTWWVETSSIVYDPDDKGKEWKLYAYKYIWLDESAGLSRSEIARLYGFIVYKHAPEPEGPWSPEEWLFAARPDTPPQPYTSMVQSRLNTLDPSLKDIYFYSRPNVVYADGVLFMTLSAFIRGRATVDRIIMLASLDHGKTWNYVGTPLRHDDMAKMGDYTALGGGGLFRDGKKFYLWAVFGNDKLAGQGTNVFEFASIAKGVLKTGKDGLPAVSKKIKLKTPAPGKYGGGYAAYADVCNLGMIMSEYSAISNTYQITKTEEKPFDE